jgi:hypothetical protein
VQQTRPYVTGRTLWGALTARLTRDLGGSGDDYAAVGRQVDAELAFTYLYPSARPDSVPLWPWPEMWSDFAWAFLGSYGSSALESAHSAEPGSLHETEFISPCTRDGQPVHLVGYVFERDNCRLDWRSSLDRGQLGGERTYGWGRVRLEGAREATTDTRFGYALERREGRPVLRALPDVRLLAHTRVGTSSRIGTIEPLVGRDTHTGTGSFGESPSTAEICWVPGSMAVEGEAFRIKEKGIWEPVSGP